MIHWITRKFTKRKKQKQLSELIEMYTFFNKKQTEALNLIVSTRFGDEYDLPPVTIEQQIQGLRSHLLYNQQLAVKNEKYELAAKYRDDLLKINFLLDDIYNIPK
jgi:hypothetical protein